MAGAFDEDEMRMRQDAKLYPVGQALRATYDADNHATLSKDVTGLMLDLARVPFEPHEFEPLPGAAPPPSVQPAVPPAAAPRIGWFAWARVAMRGAKGA